MFSPRVLLFSICLIFANFNLALLIKKACKLFSKMTASEAVVQRCSVKKVFLEISQNPQENTCVKASFLINLIKLQTGLRPATLLKRDSGRGVYMGILRNF